MSDLRSKVIRLAHANPALRPHLLPLLKSAAGPGDAVYLKALDNLTDLAELSANAQEIIDGFNLHYASGRVAGMDPQIASEFQVFVKLRDGLELATKTTASLEGIVKLFPEETKYAKALAEAKKMQEKLSKQLEASRKLIRTLSKKVAPKAITDLAKKIEAKIKSRLIDASQLDTFFGQANDGRGGGLATFVVRASVPPVNANPNYSSLTHVSLWLRESLTGNLGVEVGVILDDKSLPWNWKPASVDTAVDMFLENVKGWKNVKGEAEGAAARKGTAEAIARAIKPTLSGWMVDEPKISSDARTIEGAYRSNLPKEGAYDVGEYEYEGMVQNEIARYRKKLDPALAPFKSQIANVSVHDGEKSWIYVTVTLK